MLKKTITYEDFNGRTRTEDFYFNLSESDLHELEILAGDIGMEQHFKRLIESDDRQGIIDAFKDLIKRSYGEKSDDGRFFMKSEGRTQNFLYSAAYPVLYRELLSDEGQNAADFFNGVIPGKFVTTASAGGSARERSQAQMQGYKKPQQTEQEIPTVVEDAPIADIVKAADPSLEELRATTATDAQPTPEQLAEYLRQNPDKIAELGLNK